MIFRLSKICALGLIFLVNAPAYAVDEAAEIGTVPDSQEPQAAPIQPTPVEAAPVVEPQPEPQPQPQPEPLAPQPPTPNLEVPPSPETPPEVVPNQVPSSSPPVPTEEAPQPQEALQIQPNIDSTQPQDPSAEVYIVPPSGNKEDLLELPQESGSLMFQGSDYNKIKRLHEALIAKKKSMVNKSEEKKSGDVLEGILSKLAPTESKKAEIKDAPSIYMSSLIYTGPNTGMAWINNKKYNLGDEFNGIKLITVDQNSALIAWSVQNINTNLSPIAAMLADTKEEDLDLTKSAKGENKGEKPKAEKKNKREDIVALDEKDRIVSIRLKPNQIFDTTNFTVSEGKVLPKSKPKPMPPVAAPIAKTDSAAKPSEAVGDKTSPSQAAQGGAGQKPDGLIMPKPPVGNATPDSIDVESLIDKEAIKKSMEAAEEAAKTPSDAANPTAPVISTTPAAPAQKKLPDIQIEDNSDVPAGVEPPVIAPSEPKKPSIFDKSGESFYNQDLKPSAPAEEKKPAQ